MLARKLLNTSVGYYLYLARRYDEATAQVRKTLELDPDNAVAHSVLGWCFIGKGNAAAAIAENEKAKMLHAEPIYDGCLGYDYAIFGDRAKAEQIAAHLKDVAKQRYVSPVAHIYVCLGLGDKNKALDLLERAYEEQDIACWWVKVDQVYDSVRNESRFQALLKKVGLQ